MMISSEEGNKKYPPYVNNPLDRANFDRFCREHPGFPRDDDAALGELDVELRRVAHGDGAKPGHFPYDYYAFAWKALTGRHAAWENAPDAIARSESVTDTPQAVAAPPDGDKLEDVAAKAKTKVRKSAKSEPAASGPKSVSGSYTPEEFLASLPEDVRQKFEKRRRRTEAEWQFRQAHLDLIAPALTFLELFRGNPRAHYVRLAGKKKYEAVEKPITYDAVLKHLAGAGPSLLSIPIDQEGLSRWGAIDLDRHGENDPPVEHAVLAKQVTDIRLPLIVCRSKNGKGAWLLLFLKDAIPATQVRALLKKYKDTLKLTGEIEIFPKQGKLDSGQKGNGINLPYFGTERPAFGPDGKELTLDQFLDLAREQRSWGKILVERDLPKKAQAVEGQPSPGGDEEKPLTANRVREVHGRNLAALRDAQPGNRNIAFNTAVFWAARAHATDPAILGEADEEKLKDKLVKVARDLGLPEGEARATVRSAWSTGTKKPFTLKVLPDDPRELVSASAADVVEWFNTRYFFVGKYGGKCRVGMFEADPAFEGRLRFDHQAPEELQKAYEHIKVPNPEDPEDEIPIATLWRYNLWRRQYRQVTFAPGLGLAPDVLNLWQGFAVEPREGDCSLYLAHLRDVICAGDEASFRWLERQLAYWVQHPDEPGHVAIVLRGEKGTGKNTLADGFGHLWGRHYLPVTQGEQVTGRFNRHLMDCSVLHANEAFYAGSKQHEAALKGLITDATLSVEPKFVDLFATPNRTHLILSSNADWVVPASLDERRFAVFNVSSKHREDHVYFGAIWKQLENGGYGALLHHLRTLDLAGHNPRLAPRTAGLDEQKALTLAGVEGVWYACLCRGELPGRIVTDNRDGQRRLCLRAADLLDWAQHKRNRRWEDVHVEDVGYLLGSNPRARTSRRSMGFAKVKVPWAVDLDGSGGRAQAFVILPLAECRRLWCERRFEVPGWREVTDEDWTTVPVKGN